MEETICLLSFYLADLKEREQAKRASALASAHAICAPNYAPDIASPVVMSHQLTKSVDWVNQFGIVDGGDDRTAVAGNDGRATYNVGEVVLDPFRRIASDELDLSDDDDVEVRANTLANTSGMRGCTATLSPRCMASTPLWPDSALRDGPPLYFTTCSELRDRANFRVDLSRPLQSILKSRVSTKRLAGEPAEEEGHAAKRSRLKDGTAAAEERKRPARQVAILYGQTKHIYDVHDARKEGKQKGWEECAGSDAEEEEIGGEEIGGEKKAQA